MFDLGGLLKIPLFSFYKKAFLDMGIFLKVASCIFAVLSISTAHYVGYAFLLPTEVVLLGGADVAIAVSKIFVLYVVASVVLARIFSIYGEAYIALFFYYFLSF